MKQILQYLQNYTWTHKDSSELRSFLLYHCSMHSKFLQQASMLLKCTSILPTNIFSLECYTLIQYIYVSATMNFC